METTSPRLVRSSARSCTALLTAGCMMSAIIASSAAGCNGGVPSHSSSDGSIADHYVTATEDLAYSVAAPSETQRLGVAKYHIKTSGAMLNVTSVGNDQQTLGAIEIIPGIDGARMTFTEGSTKHVFVVSAGGSFAGKDFILRATFDGVRYSVGIDPQGRVVTTGSPTATTGKLSPLMAQMWRDIAPLEGNHSKVLTEAAYSQCFACFLCGAAVTAFLIAIGPIIAYGWPIVAGTVSALVSGGVAGASAFLATTGIAPAIAAAVIGALVAVGVGALHACYKCVTGNDPFTARTAGLVIGSGTDTGSGSGTDTGSGSGSSCDASGSGCEVCPIDTETTLDMAGAWAPALN